MMNEKEETNNGKTSNQRIRKQAVKKKIIMLVMAGIAAVIVVVGIVFGIRNIAGGNQKSVGYRSAEAAMEAFVGFLAKNDLENALRGFSYNEMAEHVSFETSLEQMQVWMPYSMDAPEYESYRSINEASYRVQAANQIKMFCYSLCPLEKLEEPFDGGMVLQLEGAPYDAKALKKALDPTNLKELTLVRTDLVKGSGENGMQVEGAEKTEGYTALYKLGKNYYKGSFVLDSYDGKWKIRSLALNSDSPYGMAVQTTEQEYLKGKE